MYIYQLLVTYVKVAFARSLRTFLQFLAVAAVGFVCGWVPCAREIRKERKEFREAAVYAYMLSADEAKQTDPDTSLFLYYQAIGIAPDAYTPRLMAAVLLEEQGNVKMAAKLYREALELCDSKWDRKGILEKLGHLQEQEGRIGEE